jgi:Trypsin
MIETGFWNNPNSKSYFVDEVIIHPGFVRETFQNDIAILRTTQPIEYDSYTQPIPLNFMANLDNQFAVFSGYGFTDQDSSFNIPRNVVNFEVITNARCRTLVSENFRNRVFDTKACVLPVDSRLICSNDNGSPLTVDNQLVGISSWHVSCVQNSPIVVERISAHMNFIRQNVQFD